MTLRSLLASTALALTLVGAPAVPVFAAPPVAYTQQADAYAMPLGDLEIVALSDGTVPQNLYELLIGTHEAEIDGLLQHAFLANPVEASINAFLVRGAGRIILVDTGSGELFGPGYGGKLVASLAAAGVAPADVTDVLITHVHTDHTGGLVAGGKPVFANAVVHVGAPDINFFLDAANAERTGYAKQYFDEAAKTVGVYAAAGKVKSFADGEEILPGIVATLHPGHTPGSAFFTVTSAGQSIVFVGDIVHVEAVQFPKPAITILYDVDPAAAAAARQQAFPDLAGARQLIAAPHLRFPGIGHVRAEDGGGFTWHPAEYRNRPGTAGE
ncbi:MBL fold metallo-hydrolase [Methylobrevis albus]|uniref:MBL fold metallo-hydrolase n=1 Tax=Methylobrevis albus TaxID=2793297 RepID=A0A931MY65_9HYPH|nr:MBL fold metallo-hydrolase [Methylobrevis albus]MBH0236396.1 MBL fold metallo-hydrolase [Methylobrevis albus]